MNLNKGSLLKKIMVRWELSNERRLYGLTYILNERLWVVWVEDDAKGMRMLGKAQLLSDIKPAPPDFTGPVTWIHLILRVSGLVKTFSLPETLTESVEATLLNRVREEIPHLADEVIYHAQTQEKGDDKKAEGVMFAVPKNVLKDQLAWLGRLQIFPDQVMLSTEVLAQLTLQQGAASRLPDDQIVLNACPFEDQGELLYIKGRAILQSQWIRSEPGSDTGFEQGVELANQAIQKAGKGLPSKTLLDADGSKLWLAVVRAFKLKQVFDFSSAELENRRALESASLGRQKLFTAIAFLSLAFFIFTLAHTLRTATQLGWLSSQAVPVKRSVSKLKQMRKEAMALRSFQAKKASPLLLVDALRQPLLNGIILNNLDYNEADSKFLIRGEAKGQNDVDDYVRALQGQSLLKVSLNRIEAMDSKSGVGFRFEITGTLQTKDMV